MQTTMSNSGLAKLSLSTIQYRYVTAGAGRRSGSGWRQGWVRWGWPLLSRPGGAVGSGPVAVESAAASVVALTCGNVCCCWVWMVVRFVCVVRVPLCARVSRVCPVCVPAPPMSFYRYVTEGAFINTSIHQFIKPNECTLEAGRGGESRRKGRDTLRVRYV